MTKQNSTSPEDTVRRYMLFIEDPNLLVDPIAVQKAGQAVADAKDPIAKLTALRDLDQARNIDEAPLREGFVSVAKTWADENQVPPSVFLDMKVPADVLRAAGFDIGTKSARKQGKTREGTDRQRAKAVPVEDIKTHALSLGQPFMIATIIEQIGGSQATVSKALKELIEAGQLANLGPVPNYTGRGRAPHQFEVVKAAA